MDKNELVRKTEDYVKIVLSGESSGHDWWHIYRVRNSAIKIAQEEGADLFIVEIAALLHDIGDRKVTGLKEDSLEPAKTFMESVGIDEENKSKILDIIDKMSFNKNVETRQNLSLEGMVVQDADRLDALGAIGIARCFAFGGKNSRVLYDPNTKPMAHSNSESYRNSNSSSLNHFYEKLLLLKDKMNTNTGKKIAGERHNFMEIFLKRFYDEWDGSS